MILALLVLSQAPLPTVGDTIWIERSIDVPAGSEVRAAPWDPDGDFGLLGAPVVRREGTRVTVAYPAVAWSAGSHAVMVPGPIVIRGDGVTDSLPAEPRTVQVASVLPPDQPPDKVVVQPQVGIVAQRVTSPLPVTIALLLAGALLSPLVWWWRRRGPPMANPRPVATGLEVPFTEWAEAGESRAVAAAAARALRLTIAARVRGMPPGVVTSRLIRVIAEQRPAWPSEEIASVLQGLDAVQYAKPNGAEVARLAEQAGRIGQRIEGAG